MTRNSGGGFDTCQSLATGNLSLIVGSKFPNRAFFRDLFLQPSDPVICDPVISPPRLAFRLHMPRYLSLLSTKAQCLPASNALIRLYFHPRCLSAFALLPSHFLKLRCGKTSSTNISGGTFSPTVTTKPKP